MADIKITELLPAGSELFQDSESFLNELNEQEMSVFGGANGDNNSIVCSDIYTDNNISVGSISVNTLESLVANMSANMC